MIVTAPESDCAAEVREGVRRHTALGENGKEMVCIGVLELHKCLIARTQRKHAHFHVMLCS